jgi:hypothetical protein
LNGQDGAHIGYEMRMRVFPGLIGWVVVEELAKMMYPEKMTIPILK